MHAMTKHTAIPARVKAAVALRDCADGRCCCVVCGSPYAAPNAHIVRRSQGGMGVEQNIVALCAPCHRAFDEGEWLDRLHPLGFYSRQDIEDHIIAYIKGYYPGWTREEVTYSKWK